MVYKANPQNWVAAQDTDGIMYFGNTDGILKYNGVKWKLIPTHLKTVVRALARGGDNKIYVGAQAEFGYLDSDSSGNTIFRALSNHLPDSLKFTDIWSIKALGNYVYFLATERLFRYDWKTGKIISWKPERYFYSDYVVRNHLYVFEPNIGLFSVIGKKLKMLPKGRLFAHYIVYGIFSYSSRYSLVCTFKHGMYLFDGKKLQPFKTPANEYLDKNEVYSAQMLPDSTYLFTTLRRGVLNMNKKGRIIRILDKKEGLQDNDVLNSFVDRDQNIWLMHENGLSKVEWFAPVTYFSDKEYQLQGAVLALLRFHGYFYVATGIGVFRMEPNENEYSAGKYIFKQVRGIDTQVWELHDFNGSLLAATTDGVYLIKGLKATSLSQSLCYTLFQSKVNKNIVYAGLANGLTRFRYRNGKWKSGHQIKGISSEIRSIYQDSSHALWLGTDYQGVLKVNLHDSVNTLRHFGTKDSLPRGYNEIISLPHHFYITTDKGLYRAKSEGKEKYKFAKVNLFGSSVSGENRPIDNIIQDKRGNAWIVTSDSIGYATKINSDRYKYHSYPYRLFNNYGIGTVYLDNNGIVWLGGEGMLIELNSNKKWTGYNKYDAIISEILVSENPDNDKNEVENYPKIIIHSNSFRHSFIHQYNNFRFDFAAPTFVREQSTRYRYKLLGYSRQWSSWKHSDYKEYTNLSHGSYTFVVEARNGLGVVSRPAKYHFTIAAPWYLKQWMVPLYLLVLVGFFFTGKKIRDSYVDRRTMHLEKIIRERTNEVKIQNKKLEESNRSLTDLNELKSEFLSMASHDLKNPISGIQGITKIMLEDLNKLDHFDEGTLKKHLRALNLMHESSKYMVNILNNLLDTTNIDSGKVLLRPSVVWINTLIQKVIDQCLEHSKSKNIEIIDQTNSEILIELDEYRTFQIVQNILDNAIKYSSLNSKVIIEANQKTERIKKGVRILVTDSGPGFTDKDKSGLFKKFNRLSARPTGGEGSTGLGLYITKSLVEMQGGVIWVESESGNGATFIIELPDNNELMT